MNKNTFIFCEKCGEKVKIDEIFCPYCGTKIIRDEPTLSPNPSRSNELSADNILKWAIAILVVVGLLFGVYFYKSHNEKLPFFNHSEQRRSSSYSTETVTVPNVVGNWEKEGSDKLKNAGFEVKISEAYDNNVPVGKIISQTPKSGANIPSGQTVYIYVSKGHAPIRSELLSALMESDFSIKGLTLGMNKREIEQKLGTPLIEGEDYFNYGNVEISFDNQGAKIIACTDISNTPRGIHVGSTLTEVEAAYGRDYSIDKDDSGLIYTYKTEKTHLRFVVDERTRKVTRIAFYRAKTNSQPAEEPKIYVNDGYNHTFRVNDNGRQIRYRGINQQGIACALYDYHTQKRVMSDFGNNYTARGNFYVVTTIVSNKNNEPIMTPTFYLIDERGRKFSADINASSTYETVHNIENLFELNPSQVTYDTEVFDIPDGVNVVNLRCETFNSNFDAIEFNVPFRIVTE